MDNYKVTDYNNEIDCIESCHDVDSDGIGEPTVQIETNRAAICGVIDSELTLSHSSYGEKIYVAIVAVSRHSGTADKLRVLFPERILQGYGRYPSVGETWSIKGQIRTYNVREGGRRLSVCVFAKEAECVHPDENDCCNDVFLDGYICKPPIYRKTPKDREICDILLAVNRKYKMSDYVPCILWGRNAQAMSKAEVGERAQVYGRLQSREYSKTLEDGTAETRTAYELSISSYCLQNF